MKAPLIPVAALLVALLLGVGCHSSPTCSITDECPTGSACRMNQCIPTVNGKALAIDVTPPNNSTSARTEYSNLTADGTMMSLVLDQNIVITGTVMPLVPTDATTTGLTYSSEAHVVVTLPSKIPARSDLQIIAEMAMDQFSFGVGSSRLNSVPATFTFAPGTTTSQTQPPVPLASPLEPMLTFTFPGAAQMTIINGQLLDDQNNPLPGYLARAFYQSNQISNANPTDPTTGSFGLLIPPGAVPPDRDSITITLTPPTPDLPQFVSNTISLGSLATTTKAAPHTFTLPAFIPASAQAPFTFTVLADGQPQSGVTVTFSMSKTASADGQAAFQATAVTDVNGVVSVLLVPGSASSALEYEVMLHGPADPNFNYASQCFSGVAIGVDALGGPVAPPTFTMTPKVQLSGSISDSTAAPAIGARVTATQVSGETQCADATPPPAVTTTSGSGGDYKLNLDPGKYTIQIDPPPMATWPRLIEDGDAAVMLSAARVHNITLPAGQILEGVVLAPDGLTPIPMANVQIFEAFCREAVCGATQPPVSLAQVQADATGTFQAVLPMVLP